MIGDVVQILEAKRATGTLSVSRGDTQLTGLIYLDEGSIAHVVAPNGKTDPFALCEILEWEGNPEAFFEFTAGLTPAVRTIRTFNGSLIIKCEIARDVFALIDQWYGSTDSVLRVPPNPPGMRLQSRHWRVLRFVDDTTSIRNVMAYATEDPSEFVETLKDLVSYGVVAVERVEQAPPEAPAPIDPPPPDAAPELDTQPDMPAPSEVVSEAVPPVIPEAADLGGEALIVDEAPSETPEAEPAADAEPEIEPAVEAETTEAVEAAPVSEPIPAAAHSFQEVLDHSIAAINLVCDTYSNTLGAVVLSNYLRKVLQEQAAVYPGLNFIEVPRTNFNQGLLVVTNLAVLTEKFGGDVPALVTALRDVLLLFRRRCSAIVGALGTLDIRGLTGDHRELLEAVGFFDGV